jgi:thiol-disulfide isomerase/thioredoxin
LLAGVVLFGGTLLADEKKQEPKASDKQEAKKADDDAKQSSGATKEQPEAKEKKQPFAPAAPSSSAGKTTKPVTRVSPGAKGQLADPARRAAKPHKAVPTKTPEGPVTGAPGIRCEKTAHDFGKNWVGGNLEHTFTMRNQGDQELEILSVRPSCGCTVAKDWTRKIPPGGEGKVPVSISTKKVFGKFSKSITVNCNDPVTPTLRLTISGQVKQYVELKPRRVNFSHIKDPQAERTMTATLTNNTEQNLELTLQPPGTVGPFSADLVEKEPGKVFELHVHAKPPYQSKRNNATLKLATNIKEQPTVDVPVSAYVPPRLDLRPEQVVLSTPPSSEMTRPIRLTNNGAKPVKLVSAEVDDELLKVDVIEKQAGKDYQVNLIVPVGYTPPPQGRIITLRTDDSEKGEFKIPVKGRRAIRRSRPAEKLVGKAAPKAEYTTRKGESLVTGQPSGTVTVLDFYTSWCGFCKKQIPKLNALYEKKYADNPDVRFVALSQDQLKSTGATGRRARSDEEVDQAFAELGATFDNALDPQLQGKSKFQVGSYPTLVLLGKTGTVEAVHFGLPREYDLVDTLEKQIDLLLAGKSRADFPKQPGATAAKTPAHAHTGTRSVSPTAATGKARRLTPADTKALTGNKLQPKSSKPGTGQTKGKPPSAAAKEE